MQWRKHVRIKYGGRVGVGQGQSGGDQEEAAAAAAAGAEEELVVVQQQQQQLPGQVLAVVRQQQQYQLEQQQPLLQVRVLQLNGEGGARLGYVCQQQQQLLIQQQPFSSQPGARRSSASAMLCCGRRKVSAVYLNAIFFFKQTRFSLLFEFRAKSHAANQSSSTPREEWLEIKRMPLFKGISFPAIAKIPEARGGRKKNDMRCRKMGHQKISIFSCRG